MKKIIRLFTILSMVITLSSCGKDEIEFPEIKGMVFIPEGEFTMGTNKIEPIAEMKKFGLRKKDYYEDARPVRKVFVKKFYMDKYEVTNDQYLNFLSDTGKEAPVNWKNGVFPTGKKKFPVNKVTWYDAYSYCYWAWKRLPTEAEWEKAARGPEGFEYPWGSEYDETFGNLISGETTEIGTHEKDKSPYGIYDMGGNVMEWVEDWYKPYPDNSMVNKDFGEKHKVLRGGSGSTSGHYILNKIFSSSVYRQYYIPNGAGQDGGFRCAKSIDKDFGKVVTD